MTPLVQEIAYEDPAACFARYAHLPFALFFDSADTRGRYSYIALDPLETLRLNHCDQPFAALKTTLKKYKHETITGLPPFQGGIAGCFGYELGLALEDIPAAGRDDTQFPDLCAGIYDLVIAFDKTQRRCWIFGEDRRDQLPKAAQPNPHTAAINWVPDVSETTYKAAVQKVINYIHAGDIFQANLSQRFTASLPVDFDSFALYQKLRTRNPAPHAAYMNFGDFQLASSSPECFLKLNAGKIETHPIKGTRKRGINPKQDLELAQNLLNSTKDNSENAMIVDLLRNDLSRVCEHHTVKVPALCDLQSFATVHHLVSTVIGQLRPEYDAIDLLTACFPGGSITGAPKIRAMEIIAELEPTQRGPYCGALGWIGFDGNMETNIAIRTLCFKNNTAILQAGGGIVADSEPQTEYEETLIKAQALFDAFQQTPRTEVA